MSSRDSTPIRPVQDHPQSGRDFVGWDLSFDCRFNISHDEELQEFIVTAAMVGEDQRKGMTTRTCTPAQIRAFARGLLALVEDQTGGPA